MPQAIPVIIAGIGGAAGAYFAGAATAGAIWAAAFVAAGLSAVSLLLAPRVDIGAQRPDTRRMLRAATLPARWIVGRARVSGALVFWSETDARTVDLALVLSDGACEGIEKIWINGDAVPFVRDASDTTHLTPSGPVDYDDLDRDWEWDEYDWWNGGGTPATTIGDDYRGKFEMWEYFAADGMQGDSLRGASGGWTAAHRLAGVSWVHIRLRQPDYGSDSSRRFWSGFPDIEFLVKGIKITWPGRPPASASVLIPPSDASVSGGLRVIRSVAGSAGNARVIRVAQDSGTSNDVIAIDGEVVTVTVGTETESLTLGNLRDALWSSSVDQYGLLSVATDQAFDGDAVESSAAAAGDYQMSGGADGFWTESAAALRYWWMTERLGIPASAIDETAFAAAHALCAQTVTVSLPADYSDFSDASTRYAINGVVNADDDPVRVNQEMDFAWQGHAVELDGVHHFRPGGQRAIARALTPDDIVEVEAIQPSPPLQDRVNAATMTLAQSAEHDYLNLGVPELEDTSAIARDGEKRPRDFGTRAFVTNPIAAARLLTVQLRRARASMTLRARVKPGASMEWMSVLPTDRIAVDLPENGLSASPMLITNTTVNPDWSVTLTMIESSDGVYDDTLVLPQLKPRLIVRPTPRIVPMPANVAAAAQISIQGDGTVLVSARISWTPAPVAGTEVRWRPAGGDWTSHHSDSAFLVVPGLVSGDAYEYQARHIGRGGFVSEWTALASVTPGGDANAPAAPTSLTLVALRGGYTARWDVPPETDYAYTEILDGDPDDGLAGATSRGTVSGNAFSRHDAPAEQIDVWIRHVDRSGNVGGASTAEVTPVSAAAATGRLRLYAVIPGRIEPIIPAVPAGYVAATGAGAGVWSDSEPDHDPLTQVLLRIESAAPGDATAAVDPDEWSEPRARAGVITNIVYTRATGGGRPARPAAHDAAD